jgi:hypothetical protein
MTAKKTLVVVAVVLVFLFWWIGVRKEPAGGTTTTAAGNISAGESTTTYRSARETTTLGLRGVAPETTTVTAGFNKTLGRTFSVDETARICTKGPYIVVRMYSNSTCEECLWVRGIYDKVAREWEGYGRVYPIRWEVDKQDNALTGRVETEIPAAEIQLWRKYSPTRVIPTFILGCKYYREGTPYYAIGDRNGEERELMQVIQELVSLYDEKENAETKAELPPIINTATTSTLFTSSTSTTSTTSTSTSTTSTSTTSTTVGERTTSLQGTPSTFTIPNPFAFTPEPFRGG